MTRKNNMGTFLATVTSVDVLSAKDFTDAVDLLKNKFLKT
jgi:hypothetical protein